MVHGLLWLPLLIFFVWITWAGWNEYRKVETYQQWATQFERAKYDILSALGQSERCLTWGLPTRQGIVNVHRINFDHIQTLDLLLKGDTRLATTADTVIKQADACLQLQRVDGRCEQIPFTDAALAQQWHDFLIQALASAEKTVV